MMFEDSTNIPNGVILRGASGNIVLCELDAWGKLNLKRCFTFESIEKWQDFFPEGIDEYSLVLVHYVDGDESFLLKLLDSRKLADPQGNLIKGSDLALVMRYLSKTVSIMYDDYIGSFQSFKEIDVVLDSTGGS